MGKEIKKKLVISGINMVDGGALSILRQCLDFLNEHLAGEYDVIAFVHRKSLFNHSGISFIELPLSKKSWWRRLYYEYYYFNKYSQKNRVHLWLSLHDITPSVKADIQAVYCHNPAPFYKMSFREVLLEPKLLLFNMFYNYLYKANINKNKFIIVQQGWLREQFKRMTKKARILVAHPAVSLPKIDPIVNTEKENFTRFFYPSFPRVFKNFDVVCHAAEKLSRQGVKNFEVDITISGNTTPYDKSLFKRFKSLSHLNFTGLLSKAEVNAYYNRADVLIFPSKLETWGLPLSEFKAFDKPILAADLEYAYETLGNYSKSVYFDPDDADALAYYMLEAINGKIDKHFSRKGQTQEPDAKNWEELFNKLLSYGK